MKPYNWTDCEHPCFCDYVESFGAGDCPDDCDCVEDCYWRQKGGTWDTCPEGRLSEWCDWLSKEAKNAG